MEIILKAEKDMTALLQDVGIIGKEPTRISLETGENPFKDPDWQVDRISERGPGQRTENI